MCNALFNWISFQLLTCIRPQSAYSITTNTCRPMMAPFTIATPSGPVVARPGSVPLIS
jgi:hypothetical protein